MGLLMEAAEHSHGATVKSKPLPDPQAAHHYQHSRCIHVGSWKLLITSCYI